MGLFDLKSGSEHLLAGINHVTHFNIQDFRLLMKSSRFAGHLFIYFILN